ncbi:hypothetical protein PUMCH_003098 [Australozyma saopauloensis]|uniref:Nuclear condensin complex subunit 3 C-terminal domain-containing protein n=1 Tax=Australozyma saopauloensis TaxID=291208 RepID=A0AAX4HB40_9ASCO|nr:hypothetical protein PUMCH_003098 [[Candida] saopauloensis]
MSSLAKPTIKQIEKCTDFSQLARGISHVFNDAQSTLSGHRKLVILLRKIQVRATQIDSEEQFNFQFTKTISKMLNLKKGEAAGDRIAKFCSLFVSTMAKQEQENPTLRIDPSLKSEDESDTSDVSDSEQEKENVACEFIDYLIRHLLRGIESRFRDVRYRIVQLLAYLVNHITEMDEQLFSALKFSLNRRLHDKESMVRIQAVVAMSRFQYYEESDPSKINHATKSLINALKHDDSPEVRRAALLNLVKTSRSIPELIERSRDVNAINRRLVFSRVAKEIPSFLDLSLEIKESILNRGLNDREPSVRAAAIYLLTKTWLPQVNDDILMFLENMQVVDSSAMPLAMNAIFESHRDRINTIVFPQESWNELTVEKAFFIRSLYDFCSKHDLYDCIDENIPELSKLAHVIQEYLKLRSSMLSSNAQLVDEYLEFHNKAESLHRLVRNGEGDLKDLQRKVEKETTIIAELQSRLSEADPKINKLQTQLKSLKAATKDGDVDKTAFQQKIESLEEELNEKTDEKDEFILLLSEHTTSLTDAEVLLKDMEKAQVHREAERNKFLRGTDDLEVKYRPFGDQKKDLEFVLEQILLIIEKSDFADVAGTRRLMPIITSALTNDNLNESNVAICIRIIRKSSIDENYFSQLCTEIITDIRDSALGENDETFMSAASLFGNSSLVDDDENDDLPSEDRDEDADADADAENQPDKRRKIAPILPPDNLLIQCLVVLQYYLEVAEDTRCNSYQLDTLIDTLIRPALVNNKNSRIRFLGYKTLGLFSLIDEGLGASNLKFFGISASKAHDEDLKALCMQIIFDIVSTHGVGILDIEGEDAVDSLSLARLFYSLLKNTEMPHLQAVVAEGLCKLFLADLLVDFGKDELENDDEEALQETQLLQMLLMSYFHPLNHENQELKQILAFCLPVYCFSHTKHQIKVSSISGDCFYRLFRTESEFAEYENLASSSSVLQLLIYWCDPRNVINATQAEIERSASHFWQAMKFLQIIEQDTSRAVKRLIIGNLGKLSITEHLGSEALRGLRIAISDTRLHILSNSSNPDFVLDQASEKNLEKFYSSIGELIMKADALETQKDVELGTVSETASQKSSRALSRKPSGDLPPLLGVEDVDNNELGEQSIVSTEKAKELDDGGTRSEDMNVDQAAEPEIETTEGVEMVDENIAEPEVESAEGVEEVDEKIAKTRSPEKPVAPVLKLVDEDLSEIDKLLAEDDEIEYDIEDQSE